MIGSKIAISRGVKERGSLFHDHETFHENLESLDTVHEILKIYTNFIFVQ